MGKNESDLNFCTLFDSNYLSQGITMINSLLKVNKKAQIFVAAMDNKAYEYLNNISDLRLTVIKIIDIENEYKDLKKIKSTRSKAEYYFTSKGFICQYVLSKNIYLKSVTYIDSDLYFFSDPQPIFDELVEASVGITKHNFHWLSSFQKKYGNFNAGWITFKNNNQGLKCLNDWKQNCLEWCFGYLEGEKYADQKYLNTWPKNHKGVKIIKNIGANVATWNVKNFKISYDNERILVNNVPLIFYHFANLKQLDERTFSSSLHRVFVPLKGVLLYQIYLPYVKLLVQNNFYGNQIQAKKDLQGEGLVSGIIKISRELRNLLFPDKIII